MSNECHHSQTPDHNNMDVDNGDAGSQSDFSADEIGAQLLEDILQLKVGKSQEGGGTISADIVSSDDASVLEGLMNEPRAIISM